MTNAVARALVLTGALLGVLACENSLLEPAAIDATYIGTRLVSAGHAANLSGINTATGETYRARELTPRISPTPWATAAP